MQLIMQGIWTMWHEVLVLLIVINKMDFVVDLSPWGKLSSGSVDNVHELIMSLLSQTRKIFLWKNIFSTLTLFMCWLRESFLSLIYNHTDSVICIVLF